MMSLNRILIAGLALMTLPGAAYANDYYRCNDRYCHDDQADETRRLNEMQLDNPGTGEDAVPDSDDYNGQGGPDYAAPPGPDDMYNDNDDNNGGGYDDNRGPNDSYAPPPDDDQSYDDDQSSDDQSSDDDDQNQDDDRYPNR
jgi:hypothetical protein